MRVETGIDLVEVARMEKSLASPRFWRGFFSPEREEIGARPNRAQSAAAVFAAKEACAKAMGTASGGYALWKLSFCTMGAANRSCTSRVRRESLPGVAAWPSRSA